MRGKIITSGRSSLRNASTTTWPMRGKISLTVCWILRKTFNEGIQDAREAPE